MIAPGFRRLIVAAGVAGLAACEAEPRYPIEGGSDLGQGGVTVAQPRYPIKSESTPTPKPASPPVDAPPPAEPADDGPPPMAAPSHSIQTQTIGPPGAALPPPPSPSTADKDADIRGRQAVIIPRARPAPPPALEIPHTVQVQPFESVYDLAERVRTPLRALIDLNGLKPPYTLTPGTVLKVPPPVIYTVKEGDTLFGVARRFSIDPRSLANLNDLPLEARLKQGQRVALPSLVRDKGLNPKARGARPEGLSEPPEYAGPILPPRPPTMIAPVTGATGASAVGEHGAATGLSASSGAASASAAVETPRVETSPVTENQVVALGKGRFSWPLKGEILSTFGPKGAGQRNDGVNIAASMGDSVKAAAAGTVVYAGNSIPAFGNLVLIKHPGGWATLYGNLGKISVHNNAQVAQGQEVGLAGVSGAVDAPQVHFEIRYAANPRDKAKPYDPASLLP